MAHEQWEFCCNEWYNYWDYGKCPKCGKNTIADKIAKHNKNNTLEYVSYITKIVDSKSDKILFSINDYFNINSLTKKQKHKLKVQIKDILFEVMKDSIYISQQIVNDISKSK